MELKSLNPWWESKEAIESDKHIRELARLKYVYHPKSLNEDFKKASIYTIRGPRQIGKTTFLKLLIREKLKTVRKDSIFYWSCDSLNSKDELIGLINEYAAYCKINEAKPEFILLDEITGIEEWQKAIKFIVDNGIADESCFILTGSNSIDIKKGAERLPGRRGKGGKDIFYMPLAFREYVEMVAPGWFEKHKSDSIGKLKFHNEELRIFFERYLNTGGIPLVINEYESNGEVPSYIYDLYYSWIVGDMLKEGKNEQTMKELMKRILASYTTMVSWDSLAKESSIKSHLTISSYFELLSNLLAVFGCFFFDLSSNNVNYGKNKKIYFYDLFILDMFSKKLNLPVSKEKIIEGIVASKIKQEDILEDIYFTKVKKETDFVLGPKKAIEVKYQNTISKEDFANKKYFKELIILSKNTFSKNIMPVHAYLFVEGL